MNKEVEMENMIRYFETINMKGWQRWLKKFEDLIEWEKSKELTLLIHRTFEKNRDSGFKNQIERAANKKTKHCLKEKYSTIKYSTFNLTFNF